MESDVSQQSGRGNNRRNKKEDKHYQQKPQQEHKRKEPTVYTEGQLQNKIISLFKEYTTASMREEESEKDQ